MEEIPPDLRLPTELPVMVLSDCTLFPNCLLPLYIFEPRYREMLDYALNNERQFCIGYIARGADDRDDGEIHEISTAGLIRACVRQPDGTSNLVLQGTHRIRIVGWKQHEPFRLATVEPFGESSTSPIDEAPQVGMPSLSADHEDPAKIANDLLNFTSGNGSLSETLSEHLRQHDDPAAIADVVAYNLVSDPDLKQQVLEIPRLATRLRLLLAYCTARAGE